MAVYLVRHAKAGDRTKWNGPDEARPLSRKGQRQAEGLVDLLATRDIGRILSSPYLRCVQTVEPLATRLGLDVETVDSLAEDTPEDEVLDLVRKLAPENPVLCTHGDVIPTLLEGVRARDGLALADDYPCAKGAVWVLDESAEGRFTAAAYIPAPAS